MLFDKHDCHSGLRPDPMQRRDQLLDDNGRKAFHRFVQEQQRRITHQRPADTEHLLFATRELVAPIVATLLQPRKQLVDTFECPGVGGTTNMHCDRQVFLDRKRTKDLAFLGHKPDAAASALIFWEMNDRTPIAADITGSQCRAPDDRRHQCTLADAVAAQNCKRLSLRQGK